MTATDRRTTLLASIVLLVSLVTNFGYLAIDRSLVMDDSPTYIGPARNLAQGNGFRNANGLSETRRTPGYPMFLASLVPLPDPLWSAVVVQHALNAALALCLYYLMLHVLGDAKAAFAGALFFAFDIPSLVHANMIVTETLFTVLTFIVFAILSRPRLSVSALALAGLTAGASVLVRPIALYVAVPLAIVIAVRDRRSAVIRVLVFAGCFAVLPLAWSARNAARGDGFTVSTITSWSLLFDRAASTAAMGDSGDYGANIMRRRNEFAREVGDPPREATYSNHILRPSDHFHVERYSSLGLRIITSHPVDYFRAYILALARTLFGGGAKQLQDLAGFTPRRAQIVILSYTSASMLIALAGLVMLFRREPHVALVSLAFVGYYLSACSMAEATSRFRVPVMPMVAVWFGCGLIEIFRRLRLGSQAVTVVP
jgi:hypothetical protein